MKKIDKDGLLLCEIQAKTFELSLSEMDCSSEVFIRRFMHSGIAKELDHPAFLAGNIQPKDVCERVDEQYGRSAYGSVKYSPDEMYWIGYIYRYFAYTYEYSSARVYRIVKPKELRGLFMPYHTMDPAQAVDRILEAKGLAGYDPADIQRQYRIFRTIRLGN